MKLDESNNIKNDKQLYNITVKGSLGVLAFGDVGLRAWRKVKQSTSKKGQE